MIQPSIRSAGMILASIAIVLAAVNAILDHRADPSKTDRRPSELRLIIQKHPLAAQQIDIRSGDAVITTLWKLPATDSLLEDHLQHFQLIPANIESHQVQLAIQSFPESWNRSAQDSLDCYASANADEDIPEGDTRVIMIHNRSMNQLLVHHYFHF